MESRTGARFTSLTTMEMLRVSVRLGEPLSRTVTVIWLVLGPCCSVGVQVSIPVAGSIERPEGAPRERLQVSVCAGKSESVALKGTLRVAPSLTLTWAGLAAIAGAELTSETVTVKVCV